MSSSEFAPLLALERAEGFRPLGECGRPGEDGRAPEAPAAEPRLADAEAYQAGLERGREEARAEQAALTGALTQAIGALDAARTGLAERWERPLLAIAVGVARAVVRHELAEHPERWLGMLRDGIRRAVDRERVVVHAPPAIAELLAGSLPELQTAVEVRELSAVPDPGLRDGACVVETRFGDLDLGVDAQLDQALRLLQEGEA
jgi:flagellar assembly protein FliH